MKKPPVVVHIHSAKPVKLQLPKLAEPPPPPRGKPNPLAVAQCWLGTRITERRLPDGSTGTFLDGTPADVNRLMRETNRLLDAERTGANYSQSGLEGLTVGKWEARRVSIVRMVHAGMTDEQIGAEFGGVSGKRIFQVRKKLGIPSNYRPAGNRFRKNPDASDASVLLEGETYYDEVLGVAVTRYPARYARNAGVMTVTARPRR